MARFSDLPNEILLQILQHFRPTYYDDVELLQLARVHNVWANMLYDGFREKYDFLNADFVNETWAYLTMTETSFLAKMGRPYAQNLPSKQTSLDYCNVWINDFKIQHDRLQEMNTEKRQSAERPVKPGRLGELDSTNPQHPGYVRERKLVMGFLLSYLWRKISVRVMPRLANG